MVSKVPQRATLCPGLNVCLPLTLVLSLREREKRSLSHHQILISQCVTLLLAVALGGCVSKSKANAQARAAFLAGQQAAARMQQAQTPSVTINGEVRNHVVPWTQGLTLAQAVVAADYSGTKDPGQIIIVHQGVATRVDPGQLLSGVNIPLQPGDIVQLMPQAVPSKQ